MNRHGVYLLKQIRGYPALTITLPTHRTSPARRQDPIRVRNLVTEATNRLLSELPKRQVEPLLARLEALIKTLNYRYTLDGLALFVNQDFGRSFYLPFEVKERVVVDESFAVRDLVYALNRSTRYWVLVLGEKPTRLYEGYRDTLIEIQEEGFPLTHTGPGGEAALPGGFGVRKSAYRDERHRQFFREVDAALRPFLLDDPLPLVVVGVDRFLSFFDEVSQHKDAIVATITGSHSKTSKPKLSELVWPLVEAWRVEQSRGYLAELDQAVGERKFVSTIGEAWRMAEQGRGKLLLVEKDFHYPATVDETGWHLQPPDTIVGPDLMDDAVDEVIKTVLEKGGKVGFLENGLLDDHQRIALILRY